MAKRDTYILPLVPRRIIQTVPTCWRSVLIPPSRITSPCELLRADRKESKLLENYSKPSWAIRSFNDRYSRLSCYGTLPAVESVQVSPKV